MKNISNAIRNLFVKKLTVDVIAKQCSLLIKKDATPYQYVGVSIYRTPRRVFAQLYLSITYRNLRVVTPIFNSDLKLSLDEFSDRFLAPAMCALLGAK